VARVLRPEHLDQQRVERGTTGPRGSLVADFQVHVFWQIRGLLPYPLCVCVFSDFAFSCILSAGDRSLRSELGRGTTAAQLSSECDWYRDQYDSLDTLVEALQTDNG
jgi:hypothetical protein